MMINPKKVIFNQAFQFWIYEENLKACQYFFIYLFEFSVAELDYLIIYFETSFAKLIDLWKSDYW